MPIKTHSDPYITAQIMALVLRECDRSASPRDLQDRLAQHGYTMKRTSDGQVVQTIPHGVEVCTLPISLSAS